MNSTALGATAEKEGKIIFISDAHEKFYYEKIKEVRYQDVYHKALVYCLGISNDTRRNVKKIYDFKTGCVKTECLHEVAVYLYLKDRANKEGTCYPAIGTIARELHLSASTAKRAISDLERNGFIQKKQRWRDNGGRSSLLFEIIR